MGGKESKNQIIHYDDALKRVTKSELSRIQAAYKRCCAFSTTMREAVFLRDVLGERVPSKLAHRIFEVMSSGSKGMSCKDLVTVLVLLTRGKQTERLKLICAVYSDEDESYISRRSMSFMVMACENSSLPQEALQLFRQNEHVSYETFREWLLHHSNVTSVTRWLLCTNGVTFSLTDNTEMPNFYQTLAGVTHLEERDIIELEKHYWTLKARSNSGLFDAKTFEGIVCPPLPHSIVKGLFHAFDENGDGHIDFKEISCGVSACCRGPSANRHKFCFKIFDQDRDGKLNADELKWMGRVMLEIRDMCSKKHSRPSSLKVTPHKDPDHGKTIISPQADHSGAVKIAGSEFFDVPLTKKRSSQQLDEEEDLLSEDEDMNEIDEIISSALQFATDQDGCLSLEEYQMWSMDDRLPTILLNVVIEVCHIALGLKPLTPCDEGNIIRGWMERTSFGDVQPGETWYIVSMTWWNKWKLYTSYDPVLKSTSHWEESGHVGRTSSAASSACEAHESLSSHHNKPALTESVSSSSTNSHSSTGSVPSNPGAINNQDIVTEEHSKQVSTLTDEGGRLKGHVCVGRDFVVIPEPVWKALLHWYSGQPILPRIVPKPLEGEMATIEFHRLHVTILKHQMVVPPQHSSSSISYFSGNGILSGLGNTTLGAVRSSLQYIASGSGGPRRLVCNRATFSPRHTIQQVQTFLSQRMFIPFDSMRLWNYIDENNLILMEEDSATLEAFGVKQNSQLLVEVRNTDLSWPEEIFQLARHKKSKPKRAIANGATGLSNLGNTCFMNSAVQCLSNTRPLTEYTQSEFHLYELNKTNPLGMKGHIAKRYSDLIRDMWSGNSRTIAPLKLRWTISKYAPRFNGCQQHDSQELLAFLLDGLHEDLNRVHDKPYTELKDSDGRPDETVAQEAWENHLMRNQSIIVDLFHGQMRSQVCCMSCQSVSVRFDPFTYLSLPLPMENSLYFDIIFVSLESKTPVRYGMRLSMEENVETLRTSLGKLCSVDDQSLLIASVFGATIKNTLSGDVKIRSIASGGNLYAFEIPLPQKIIVKADKKTASLEANKTIIKTTATSVKGLPDKNLPSSVHECRNTSVTNLNAVYDIANDNKVIDKSIPVTKIPGRSVQVQHKEEQIKQKPTVNGSSFHCVPPQPTITSKCYVIAFHRKTFHQENYFISPQKNCNNLFGIPVVVPFVPAQSASELYKNVWQQVSRLVSPLPPSKGGRNHAADCDESLGSLYPFILRSVGTDGMFCGGDCPWYSFCHGCLIPHNDEPYTPTSDYIAIDWNPTALHLRYQQSKEKEVINDASVVVPSAASGARHPINLNECLRAFTSEEHLGKDEQVYCSKCKEHQLASKKLDIWRLPPILIIHLKRFQLVNGRWIKSHKVVNFPKVNFDPSSFMTKRNVQETTVVDEKVNDENNDESVTVGNGDGPTKKMKSVLKDVHISFADGIKDDPQPRPQRRPSSGPARVRQPSFREDSPPLFNLYAVSCHSGIMGGGHYVSYSKNPNGKWYYYNDSSCKEVSVDGMSLDSAYLLFYERQDIDYEDFMPSINGKKPVDISSMDEDFESEYKKVCTVQ